MMRRFVLVVAAAVLVATTAGPVRAQDGGHYLEQLGWGTAAVGANLLYMPVKIVYAVLGGFVGGLAYAASGGNPEAGQLVWSPALSGSYVLTPAMLRGQEPIVFSGAQYESEMEGESHRPIREETIGEN